MVTPMKEKRVYCPRAVLEYRGGWLISQHDSALVPITQAEAASLGGKNFRLMDRYGIAIADWPLDCWPEWAK